jgi:hypothetical protein
MTFPKSPDPNFGIMRKGRDLKHGLPERAMRETSNGRTPAHRKISITRASLPLFFDGAGTPAFPFSFSETENGAPGGRQEACEAPLGSLAIGRPRALRGRAHPLRSGCDAPLALHPSSPRKLREA